MMSYIFRVLYMRDLYCSLYVMISCEKKKTSFKFSISLHYSALENFSTVSWIGVWREAKSSILLIFF